MEMEALIRCRNASLKDTSPEVFIAVAESSGLIIPITWWMMDKVAKDTQKFSKRINNIRINVNMSPKILKSRDLIERLTALDKRHPINGNLIGFEITEGAIIENVDQVLTNLKALRDRGFRIALDDFGTGYSSLSYIKNLPLDKIKIDKRFVSGISSDSRDEALINSIISIAGNLKMELVAEGVEMPNQLTYLNDRGCQFFQGYLFSKPVPIEDIIENYDGT
jgi:EAL domain-containing protein (putative c-di-GMP-specific phosphodiesterase class I)